MSAPDPIEAARRGRSLLTDVAGRLGYAEFVPRTELRPYVRCIWTLGDLDSAGRVEQVLPDGCCEVLVNRADPFLARGERQPLRMVVGQLKGPFEITPTGVVDLLGIRFEPGGLFPFLGGRPLSELTGGYDGLDRALSEDLCSAPSVADVERVLLDRMRPTDGLARAAVAEIRRARGALAIGALGDALAVRPRTLERIFAREVGVPAKVLARVERFRAVLERLDAPGSPRWAGLALDCGFADQAHLIRDFRGLAGVTPAVYVERARGLADCFVPDGSVGNVQ